MENTKILELLSEAGLSKKEAALYLAGVELGEATLQEIAKEAGIKRPTAYDIMGELEKRGLFSVSARDKKRRFIAESPEAILGIMKMREQSFAKTLPELKLLLNTADTKPRVKFYEGVEGLKTMYWDTLESKGTILVYGAIDEMWDAMGHNFIKEYVKERIRRKINIRGLVPNTAEAQEYVKNDEKELRHLILVPKDRFNFSNEINIYNNKVAIFSFPEKVGTIIESEKITQTQRAIFELAWLGAIKGI